MSKHVKNEHILEVTSKKKEKTKINLMGGFITATNVYSVLVIASSFHFIYITG